MHLDTHLNDEAPVRSSGLERALELAGTAAPIGDRYLR